MTKEKEKDYVRLNMLKYDPICHV